MLPKLFENDLTAEEYCALRKAEGWSPATIKQVEVALENSLYTLALRVDHDIIGMARLVGDRSLAVYVQDVIIRADYRGEGLGQRLVEKLLDYVRKNALQKTEVCIGLMAQEGSESFYERFGFNRRPAPGEGDGMVLRMQLGELHDG